MLYDQYSWEHALRTRWSCPSADSRRTGDRFCRGQGGRPILQEALCPSREKKAGSEPDACKPTSEQLECGYCLASGCDADDCDSCKNQSHCEKNAPVPMVFDQSKVGGRCLLILVHGMNPPLWIVARAFMWATGSYPLFPWDPRGYRRRPVPRTGSSILRADASRVAALHYLVRDQL